MTAMIEVQHEASSVLLKTRRLVITDASEKFAASVFRV